MSTSYPTGCSTGGRKVAHYVTLATDNSHYFQNYLLGVAIKVIQQKEAK
jgi:hypothetical protein